VREENTDKEELLGFQEDDIVNEIKRGSRLV
jgi:hypothetical protein